MGGLAGLAGLGLLLPAQAWDAQRLLASAQRQGPQALAQARALQAAIGAALGQPESARLAVINQFVNEHVNYAEDIDTTGEIDHWDSPLEVLARGAGDCEDYAIAKYFSLIAAGVPPAQLRLVYVRAERAAGPQPHMVLAWYPPRHGEPLMLDNLRPDIRPASARPDLRPVFSFNAEGLWQGTAGASAGDPAARLARWRAVLGQARNEGFIP